MAKKISKFQKLWQAIDVRIQNYPIDELRLFFAAAAKFLIESRYWDDQHPKTLFDHDDAIQRFHEGFEEFSKAAMLGGRNYPGENQDLLQLIRKAAGRKGRDLKYNTAKKKLGVLREQMQDRLKRRKITERELVRKPENQPLRGLTFYAKIIQRKYLTEDIASPRENDNIIVLPAQVSPEDPRYGRKHRRHSAGKAF